MNILGIRNGRIVPGPDWAERAEGAERKNPNGVAALAGFVMASLARNTPPEEGLPGLLAASEPFADQLPDNLKSQFTDGAKVVQQEAYELMQGEAGRRGAEQ